MAKKEGKFDLVKAVFERRLHQADMDRILAELSVADRGELVAKMGALLDRISALVEVYNKISDTLSLDVLLPRLMAIVSEALRADRSTLFLNDPDHNELFSRVAQGDRIGEIRFPNERGIAGSVFRSGRAEIIPDAYQDVRFNPEVDKQTGYRTRTILCMPVVNKEGEKLGVVQVLNKKHGSFTPIDEKRLKAFTAQAAIALENAKLFEDVTNERNYNESILKSLSNGVITLDAECKVIKVNNAGLGILKWKADEVAERPVAELFPGEGNAWVLKSLEKVTASGQTDITMDSEIRLAGGALVSANMTVVPLIDVSEQAIGYMLVFEDITAAKRMKSTMARYMTKEVADRLLESGEEALGGATQVASVLFSDIRSFTTISEALGARGTVGMLNDYFTEMIDVMFKMIRVLRRINVERRLKHDQEIRIGVGLSTGELVVGNIGSPKRMDYTVIGDTVNLASRLEGATKYYGVQVLFSEFTVQALKGDVRCRELDLIRVKGKVKPVAVFEGLDHHTPETFPEMERTLTAFKHGLKRYRARDWKGAISSFQEALAANCGDGPSKLYLDRCRHYLENPPDESWDGVWVMQEK